MSNFIKFKKYVLTFIAITVLAVFASGCSSIMAKGGELSPDNLQVHFISVGQGDSELIKLPTGENVLIDAGDTDCDEYLVNYIKSQGVEEIDTVIATHPHSDHIGSMQDVLENFKVNKIMMPDFDYDTVTYTNLLYSIEENNVERIVAKYGDSFDEGAAHFDILGPVKQYEDANNISLVVMMTYGQTKYLFTGDQEAEAEKDLISMGYNLNADVLKVGHHGSSTSSSQEFLNAVRPSIAVIEVGEGNKYNLPEDEIIMRIARGGTTVYRTDKSGNIVISSDGEELYVTTDDTLENILDPEKILGIGEDTSGGQNASSSEAPQYEIIGNKNSKVYHADDCGQLPNEENRVYFSTQQEAENAGYRPHSGCVE